MTKAELIELKTIITRKEMKIKSLHDDLSRFQRVQIDLEKQLTDKDKIIKSQESDINRQKKNFEDKIIQLEKDVIEFAKVKSKINIILATN